MAKHSAENISQAVDIMAACHAAAAEELADRKAPKLSAVA